MRKVRILLQEKDIQHVWNTDYYSFLQDINPLGKVPVWVCEDGEVMFDSRVICEFLELAYPSPIMIPSSGVERLEIKRWEALADGICDAAVAVVVEEARDVQHERSIAWISKQIGKVLSGLGAAEAALADRSFCCSGRMTLADAALGAALGYVDFRLKRLGWRESHPQLAHYATLMSERPAFSLTAPS